MDSSTAPFFTVSFPGFVIQGGGFTEDMTQKRTQPPIKNEADNGLKNERGTLSMARTNDINSATSQFFVNLKDNDFLDHKRGNFGYAVFARVTEGMDVIDKIAAVEDRPAARFRGRAAGSGHHEKRIQDRPRARRTIACSSLSEPDLSVLHAGLG